MAFISHLSNPMADNNRSFSHSPLSFEDVERIESTGLSSLERHHLRLLAHCLECFKKMAGGASSGSLPQEQDRLKWCLDQPNLVNDQAFISVLLEQFAAAGSQLEKVATLIEISPLELTLDDLLQAVINSKK